MHPIYQILIYYMSIGIVWGAIALRIHWSMTNEYPQTAGIRLWAFWMNALGWPVFIPMAIRKLRRR